MYAIFIVRKQQALSNHEYSAAKTAKQSSNRTRAHRNNNLHTYAIALLLRALEAAICHYELFSAQILSKIMAIDLQTAIFGDLLSNGAYLSIIFGVVKLQVYSVSKSIR